MVSKPLQDQRDMFREYKQLGDMVTQGRVAITLFDAQYAAKSHGMVGSYGELCPRQCHEGYTQRYI
jgi:hypothetical protein